MYGTEFYHYRYQISKNVRLMMIEIVMIGTKINSLNNLFSYLRCMKNQSTKLALAEAIAILATMLHSPIFICAALIVIPVKQSNAIQTKTNTLVGT